MNVTDRVMLDNLCAWPLYFRRSDDLADIRIPGGAKGFNRLTYEEVRNQVQMGNPLFVGQGNGDHANIYIVDDEVRRELFGFAQGVVGDVIALTEEHVSALLAIKNKEKFNTQLHELVKTDAEKKMVIDVAKKAGADEMPAWKLAAIEKLASTAAI